MNIIHKYFKVVIKMEYNVRYINVPQMLYIYMYIYMYIQKLYICILNIIYNLYMYIRYHIFDVYMLQV